MEELDTQEVFSCISPPNKLTLDQLKPGDLVICDCRREGFSNIWVILVKRMFANTVYATDGYTIKVLENSDKLEKLYTQHESDIGLDTDYDYYRYVPRKEILIKGEKYI